VRGVLERGWVSCGLRQKRKARSSFLKKRTKRLLFFRSFRDAGHGLHLAAGPEGKSLLLLFFRKEDLALPSLR
jgi:hypothetical protein